MEFRFLLPRSHPNRFECLFLFVYSKFVIPEKNGHDDIDMVDRLSGRQVNKNRLPIMPSSPILTPGPVNPGQQVDKYGISILPCSPIVTSGPVNPGRQVDRSTGGQVWITHNSLLSYIYLRFCQHVYRPPVYQVQDKNWRARDYG